MYDIVELSRDSYKMADNKLSWNHLPISVLWKQVL